MDIFGAQLAELRKQKQKEKQDSPRAAKQDNTQPTSQRSTGDPYRDQLAELRREQASQQRPQHLNAADALADVAGRITKAASDKTGEDLNKQRSSLMDQLKAVQDSNDWITDPDAANANKAEEQRIINQLNVLDKAQGNADRYYSNADRFKGSLAAAANEAGAAYANALGTLSQLPGAQDETGRILADSAYAGYLTDPLAIEQARAEVEKGWRPESLGILDTNQKITDASFSAADRLDERDKAYTARAKEGADALDRFGVDLTKGAFHLATDAAVRSIPVVGPAIGMLPMVTRAFGGAAMEARHNGADEGQQLLYGIKDAGIEYFTEKMAGLGSLRGEKGFLDNLVKGGIDRFVARGGDRFVGDLIAGFGSESAEEMVSYALNHIADKLLRLSNDGFKFTERDFDVGDMLYEGLLGGVLGLFGSAVKNPENATKAEFKRIIKQSTEEAAKQRLGALIESRLQEEDNSSFIADMLGNKEARAAFEQMYGGKLTGSAGQQIKAVQQFAETLKNQQGVGATSTAQAQQHGTEEKSGSMFVTTPKQASPADTAPAQKPKMNKPKSEMQKRVQTIINAASTQNQLIKSLQFIQSKPELDAAFEELTGGDIDAYLTEASQEAAGGVAPQEGNPAPATPENAQQQAPGEFNSVNEAGESSEPVATDYLYGYEDEEADYNDARLQQASRNAAAQNKNMRDASDYYRTAGVDFLTGDSYNESRGQKVSNTKLGRDAYLAQQLRNDDYIGEAWFDDAIDTARMQIREDRKNASRIADGQGEWSSLSPKQRARILSEATGKEYYVSGNQVVRAKGRVASDSDERSGHFYEQEMRDAGVKDVSQRELQLGDMIGKAKGDVKVSDREAPPEYVGRLRGDYSAEELSEIERENRRRDAQRHRENTEAWREREYGGPLVTDPRLGTPNNSLRSEWLQRIMRNKQLLADLVKGEGDFNGKYRLSLDQRFDMLRSMYPDADWRIDAESETIYLPGDPVKNPSIPSERWQRDTTKPQKTTAVPKGVVANENEAKPQQTKSSDDAHGTQRRVSASELERARSADGRIHYEELGRTGGVGYNSDQRRTGAAGAVYGQEQGKSRRAGQNAGARAVEAESNWRNAAAIAEKRGAHLIGHLTKNMAKVSDFMNRLGCPVTHMDVSEASSKNSYNLGLSGAFLGWGYKTKVNKYVVAVHEAMHYFIASKSKTGLGGNLVLEVFNGSGISRATIKSIGQVFRSSYEDKYSRSLFGKSYSELTKDQRIAVGLYIGEEIFNSACSSDYARFRAAGMTVGEFQTLRRACLDAALDSGIITPEQMEIIDSVLTENMTAHDDYLGELPAREKTNATSDSETKAKVTEYEEAPESSKQYFQQNRLRKSDFENRETERGGAEAQYKAEQAEIREEIEHDEAYDRAQEEGKLLAEMKKAYGEKTQKSLADLAKKVKGLVESKRLTTSGQRGYVDKNGNLVGHVKGDVTEDFSYNEGGRDIESFAHVLGEFAAGRQTFMQLAEAYDKLGSYSEKKKGSYFYDKIFAEQFERLRDALDNGDVPINEGALDPKFVKSVEDLTKRVVHRFEYMQKMLKFRSHLAEVYGEGKPFRTKAGALAKALEAAHRFQLRPSTAFKMLSGYDKTNGSAWYELADMARDATKNYINTFQNAQDYLRELTERKDWEDFSTGKTTVKNVIPNLKYDGGRLSANAAVGFLKMLETDGAYDHIIRNGVVEMARTEKELYSGQNNNGFGDATGYSQTFDPISDETREMLKNAESFEDREAARSKAVAELNAIKAALHAEVEACPAAKAFYDASFAPLNFLKKALNKTSRKVWGTDAAVQDKFYWPLEAGGKREGNELLNDHSFGLDQYRNVQARTGDRGGLKVRPATDVMQGYIRSASHWAAYQELSDMLEILSKDFRDTSSITQLLNDNAGKAWSKWLDNYWADLNGNRGKDKGYAGKIIGSLRSNLAQSSLLLNAGVALKQAPSGLDFMTVLDADIVAKRFATGFFRSARSYRNNPLIQTMEAYTKMLKNRQAGYNTVETGEATETGRKGFVNKLVDKLPSWMTNWITKTDFRTVANGLLACEDQVKRNIKDGLKGYADLQVGTDAYYQKVADLFENAVMDTQPIYNKEYRADALRTDNEVLRILNMFRTQQTQNYNNLVETIGEYNAAKQSGDEAATKAARNRMGRTIAGQVSSAFVFAMLDAAAKMLMHKKKQYEDEDGNLSASIISQKVGWNFANSLASTSWLASKLSPFVINQMTKLANKATDGKVAKSDFYSGSLDGTLALVDDFASALDAFTTKPSRKTGKALLLNLASLTGMPLKNGYNIVNAAIMHFYLDPSGKNVNNEDDIISYLDNYDKLSDTSKAKQSVLRAISVNSKGNSEGADTIMATLNLDDDDIAKAAKQQLKDSFIAGSIDSMTYRNMLEKYFGMSRTEAWDLWKDVNEAKKFADTKARVFSSEEESKAFDKTMSKLTTTTDPTGKGRFTEISLLGLNEEDTDTFVKKYMTESFSKNYDALRSIKIKPNDAARIVSSIDTNESGSLSQDEVYDYLLTYPSSKKTVDALWKASGWKTGLDKYAEDYAKQPANILASFGMSKAEAKRVAKQLNYDGKNDITQEDFFNYLKKHPDQEEALKAVFAVKWPKSNYESKKRKYS